MEQIFTADEEKRLLRADIDINAFSIETQKKLKREIMPAVKTLMKACGDDPERAGLEETPFRVMKAFLEYTRGYGEDPASHLETTFPAEKQDLVMVRDIEFFSLCEHHLAPFYGKCHLAYIPGKRITGLSKLARVVESFARRFQVQERMTSLIADTVYEKLDAQGVICVIEAKHMCMAMRGVAKVDAITTTSAIRGIYNTDSDLRAETMNLIRGS